MRIRTCRVAALERSWVLQAMTALSLAPEAPHPHPAIQGGQRPGGLLGRNVTNKLKPLLAARTGLWKIKGAGVWETATNLMKRMNSRCGLWPAHSCCPWTLGENPGQRGKEAEGSGCPRLGLVSSLLPAQGPDWCQRNTDIAIYLWLLMQ